MRIGLIGFGAIGSKLYELIGKDAGMRVVFVLDKDKGKTKGLPKGLAVQSLEEGFSMKPELVVEAASHEAVKEFGEKILGEADLLLMSVGSLADKKIEGKIASACKKSGKKLFLPSGAIIGLDGLSAAKQQLESVEIETRKNPKSLGRGDSSETIVFEGSAREGCRLYPKNVNVAATLSLNGIGFEKTKVKLVSDPAAKTNSHTIRAKGAFGSFLIRVENTPSKNPATSGLAALSAFDSIKKISRGISFYA
ncbi:MAG: aspartate dehydrogenase [Candidatus Diapherotrites archaeon]